MSVMIVPAVSPPMIVMAIELYMGSPTRGIIPTMVVSEDVRTRRTRVRVGYITAVYVIAFSSC